MPKKNAEKKITDKTMSHYEKILSEMSNDQWYKTADFEGIVAVKERRMKILLNELVENGFLIEDGSTKGKRYKKL